jgi:DNA repair exonuclease SbcCD ATPase subunit
MEDYDKVLEATNVAENANGVAAEKMTVYNESLEAAQNRLTASVQQFAQDSNLDRTLALAYDGLSKVVEILNILLNKIPVLSPLIKALGVALAAAFIKSTIEKAKETGSVIDNLIKLLTGTQQQVKATTGLIPALSAAFTGLTGVINGTTTASAALGAVWTAMGGWVGAAITAIGALVALLPSAVRWFNDLKNAKENALKQSSQELDEANQNLEETNGQIKDIQDKISEINSKDTITLTDQAEKERLEEELETLKQIKQVQEDIAASKKSETLQGTKDVVTEKYGGEDKSVDEYLSGLKQNTAGWENFTMSSSLDSINTASDSINELAANVKYLDEQKKELNATDSDYQEKLDAINQKEQENTQQLLSKKQELLEYKQQLIDLGDTSSEEYQLVNDKINDITIALDPSKFPKIDLGEMIQTEGMENKIKMVIQSGSEAGKKVAEGYAKSLAEEIENNPVSLEAWKEALNIPDGQELGVGQLTQEILALFQEMFGGISEASETASQGFTDQHTALDAYQEAVQNVHDSTTDLTAAYQDMISKGYISESVVKKLTAAHPELTKELKLENGQYKINLQTLKDVYTTEVNKSIASIKAEKEQTQATIDAINKRIQAYELEMNALALDPNATEADKAKLIGLQHSIDMNKAQLKRLQNDAADVDKYIANLQQNAANWSPTKSSGSKSSGKSAADKAAKDFENAIKEKIKNLKSIVELYSERTDWDDPTVIQEFTNDYNNLFDEVINNPKARKILADSFNLDISEMSDEKAIEALTALWKKQAGTIDEARQKLQDNYLKGIQDAAKAEKEQFDEAKKQIEELNKMTTNMIKTYVGLLEKAGNLVFSLLEKVSDRYDKQIDNLDKIMDGLDDQKDAFDDKIDAQKEYLQLQKEEMDNEDKLAEKTKSIADIDARLIELQYDDSAAAQAERLKLLDQRAEAEKDLKDLQAEQAYDSQINALDAQKKQFDKDIEAQKKALEEQKKALEESQTKFENTLNKIKSGFDGFIKVLNSDIFQNLAANLLNSIDGDTLKQALYSWNRLFGSGIDADATNVLQAYGTAGKYGWTPGKNMQDFLNMFTQGSNTQQQILDQVEQAISSNKVGNLDISGYKNNIDFLNKSWDSFKQNAIDSVTQVGESSQSIVKNLWDFGNKMLNQESASGSGVVRTIAKGISTTIKSGKKGISTFLQQGIQANQALGISGQGILSQVGNFAQNIMKLVGGSGGGILNTVIQFGSTLLGKVGGISSQLVKGIGAVGGGAIKTIASVGGKALSSVAGIATGIFGSGATAGITSMIPTLGSAAGGLGSAAGLLGLGAKGGLIGLAVAGGAIAASGIKSNLKNLWGSNLPTWKKVTGTALNFLTPAGLISGVKNIFKGIFGRHHSGADYVKKQNPALDKILGLGSDETVSILKVGEAVVPTWANNASSSASNSNYTGAATQAVRAAQQASRISSSVNNSNSSVVNTISIPINIQGNADESTVKLLREESDKIAKMVFKQINKQTNMSGYRNIRAATI